MVSAVWFCMPWNMIRPCGIPAAIEHFDAIARAMKAMANAKRFNLVFDQELDALLQAALIFSDADDPACRIHQAAFDHASGEEVRLA